MPPDPENRAELLEHIITTGTKRRRRRRAMLGGALVALVAIVAVPLTWPDDGDRDEVTVVDDPGESTTTSSTSSSTSSSTTSTSAAPVETTLATTPAEEPTTTTEAPPVCRNSYDPRCGPFYWDYDPATFPNQPLTITISHEPEEIVAGQQVVFTVTFHDPDGGYGGNCAHGRLEGGQVSEPEGFAYSVDTNGGVLFRCAIPGCMRVDPEPYGPWDPPPPSDRGPVTYEFRVVYPDPGTFPVTFEDDADFNCGTFHGYDSAGEAMLEVVVG